MRLLVITNDYPPKPGGIQQWLGNLVDHFAGEVRVLAPADGAATTASGESIVRRHHKRFMWPRRAVANWVGDEVEEFGPDAILFGAPHPLPSMIPRLRSRGFTGKIGIMTHGAEVTIPGAFPLIRQLLARTLRRADVLFAVSRYTAAKVGAMTGSNVIPVGAGVDLEDFVPASPATSPTIGCVSRFVPRKGQDRVIEAAASLRASGVPATVLLVGRGRKRRSLERHATRRGVPTRFEVDVAWERLPGLYREMAVFAMPSRSRWLGLEVEGLGIVYLEAAASGLPVIAGDSGGAPEAVVDGVTGYVVGDTDSLESALRTILENPSLAAEMGERGRAWVEENHTWPLVAERVAAGLAEP